MSQEHSLPGNLREEAHVAQQILGTKVQPFSLPFGEGNSSTHDTEECYDLKNQIKDLIHQGHLVRYVRKSREPSHHLKGLVEKHINVSVSGPASGGDNSLARKAYARAIVEKRQV
ncbi:hypothetical protein B296_00026829 [Ensete ventricosum]|uniref:Uncharacterized protein n=1 Tax=Ensete ventricosum TaxID=4639 RepID=A0A426ZEZ8_ENSVE|nr:hypothetical protein B296_00026829 [Ensete ventricosum]